MRVLRLILLLLAMAGGQVMASAAEVVAPEAVPAVEQAGAAHAEHGLTQHAVPVFEVFGFPVTNSMVVTWIVAVALIVFAQLATRRMKEVPEGAQNFWEWMVESLSDFLEGIIGAHLVRRTFWFFA